MVTGVDHVAIAVRSLADAVPAFEKRFGCKAGEWETVADQGARVAFFRLGNTRVELLEPLAPDSVIGKFLGKRGEGLHHICLRVKGIDAELARLAGDGVRLVDRAPRTGGRGCKIAFLHPEGAHGVLIELAEAEVEAEAGDGMAAEEDGPGGFYDLSRCCFVQQ